MHIVVGLCILKDEDFSETAVLEQSLECSLRSLRDQRLSGSNTLERLFFGGFPAFWNDYSFYLTVPEIFFRTVSKSFLQVREQIGPEVVR